MSNWKDLIAAELVLAPEKQQIHTEMTTSIRRLLVQASLMRGVSMATYVRRATMAMIAHDLGIGLAPMFEVEGFFRTKPNGPEQQAAEARFWEIDSLRLPDD